MMRLTVRVYVGHRGATGGGGGPGEGVQKPRKAVPSPPPQVSRAHGAAGGTPLSSVRPTRSEAVFARESRGCRADSSRLSDL